MMARKAVELDLIDWVRAVWKRRGLIADRRDAEEWLARQGPSEVARLERLKASGARIKERAE